MFEHTPCGELALQSVTTSRSRSGDVETMERTAVLVDRAGHLEFVRRGDGVCARRLAVREVGEAEVRTDPDTEGRNCYRP